MGPTDISRRVADAHDGAGHLTIDDRPFILQIDHAEVDLGSVTP